ncbi:cysteine-rich receptor-like protein kinase 10 [Durio zibethinus]|uniref:Cysteine-rich receptor-like protein kinase 10 n=1 Tax=Durio zibethinus TaxID=66656 RepID=A0A6P5Z7T1_DURZI|nr:cysteine-rich receptor-like protein kinase 10 [Durio zibethinus]
MHSPVIVTLQLLLFFSLLSSIYASEADQERYFFCDSTGNYTTGGIYGQNVNITLTSLAANASFDGFSITTVGQGLDVVNGLVQCRSDVSQEDCQTCVDTAAKEISQFCPNKKEAMIGYNNCSLRYSNWRFFSTASSSPIFAFYNKANATDPDHFNTQLANLLRNLSSTAASNASKFAVNSTSYSAFSDIYGMVQCTRDLPESRCSSCLQAIISFIPQCCNQKQGARIFTMSCNLRFELYSFFLTSSPPISRILSPPSVSPLEPNLTPGVTTTKTSADGKFCWEEKHFKNHCGCSCIHSNRGIAGDTHSLWLLLLEKGQEKSSCLWLSQKIQTEVMSCPYSDVNDDSEKNMESLLIGLDTLKAATRNFSDENKLGQGGFGPVFKGKLFDGGEIAVKRMSSNSRQGVGELKTEVMLVAKLLHRNLVKLLGFCLEGEEKLLVYEYLPNGSLDKILFDQSKRFSLEWERRYKIIVGIARGLLYLHEDSQLRIIHRDLKASNILLDEQMNPKISDFGLAKLFGESQTKGNTNRIAGTYGYMAPEYAKNGYFSTKSDVYSFGVLVLEIVTGRKSNGFSNSINLQSHAWVHWTNGTALELLDPVLNDQWPRFEVLNCIHIGLLCVQEAAASRPSMSEIITMLCSHSMTAPAPSLPAFFISRENFTTDSANDSGSSQSADPMPDSIQRSVNEVTISELPPR